MSQDELGEPTFGEEMFDADSLSSRMNLVFQRWCEWCRRSDLACSLDPHHGAGKKD